MANINRGLESSLYTYLLEHSLREPAVLSNLREHTASMVGHQMQISPDQGQLMGLLVKMLGAKKTLDIGTYTGYSALVVALALPEDGQLIACDTDPVTTHVAKIFWEKAGCAQKITLHLRPALETLDFLLDSGQQNSFDFIFIDADKKSYPDYYEKAIVLLRTGGLVMIDNVFRDGRVTKSEIQDEGTEVIKAFNQHVFKDKRVSISMLPISDGVTIARKEI